MLPARTTVPRSVASDTLDLLRQRGYPATRIIRIDSAGDAETSVPEVLFTVESERRVMRGYVKYQAGKDPLVWVKEGWDLPDGYEVEAGQVGQVVTAGKDGRPVGEGE